MQRHLSWSNLYIFAFILLLFPLFWEMNGKLTTSTVQHWCRGREKSSEVINTQHIQERWVLRLQVVIGNQALSRFSWGLRRFLVRHGLHCSWWHRAAPTLKSLPASTQNYTEPPFSVMARFSNQFPSWKAGVHLHPPHPPTQTAWLTISSLWHLLDLLKLLPLLAGFLLLPGQL